MKKQKKRPSVVKHEQGEKAVVKVTESIKDGIPGEEDVLLDQVAVKPHPEYPEPD